MAKKTVGGGSKEGLFYSLIRDNTVDVAAKSMLRLSKNEELCGFRRLNSFDIDDRNQELAEIGFGININ